MYGARDRSEGGWCREAPNAQIGDELFMSLATVKAHVSTILTKLDLSNRTQIALLAPDAGLTG